MIMSQKICGTSTPHNTDLMLIPLFWKCNNGIKSIIKICGTSTPHVQIECLFRYFESAITE